MCQVVWYFLFWLLLDCTSILPPIPKRDKWRQLPILLFSTNNAKSNLPNYPFNFFLSSYSCSPQNYWIVLNETLLFLFCQHLIQLSSSSFQRIASIYITCMNANVHFECHNELLFIQVMYYGTDIQNVTSN